MMSSSITLCWFSEVSLRPSLSSRQEISHRIGEFENHQVPGRVLDSPGKQILRDLKSDSYIHA